MSTCCRAAYGLPERIRRARSHFCEARRIDASSCPSHGDAGALLVAARQAQLLFL